MPTVMTFNDTKLEDYECIAEVFAKYVSFVLVLSEFQVGKLFSHINQTCTSSIRITKISSNISMIIKNKKKRKNTTNEYNLQPLTNFS